MLFAESQVHFRRRRASVPQPLPPGAKPPNRSGPPAERPTSWDIDPILGHGSTNAGRSGCARSGHTTRPRSRLCPNAVITRPPTRPSESSGDSMRPRRRQSAGVGILGGGVPTYGSDSIRGEPMGLLARFSHPPCNAYPGFDRSEHVRGSGPPAGPPALDLCAPLSPKDDPQAFERPEFKAMFAWPLSVGVRFRTRVDARKRPFQEDITIVELLHLLGRTADRTEKNPWRRARYRHPGASERRPAKVSSKNPAVRRVATAGRHPGGRRAVPGATPRSSETPAARHMFGGHGGHLHEGHTRRM